jgi:hypothetical protein
MFKIGDDLEIQAASMRGRLLLETFDEGLGDILDSQGCHMGSPLQWFHSDSIMDTSRIVPYWSSQSGHCAQTAELADDF